MSIFSIWQPTTRYSTPDVALPMQSRRTGSPPLACWQYLSKETIGLLCSKGTLLPHVQLGVNQDHEVLFCKDALQLRVFQHIPVTRNVQVFVAVKLQNVPVVPFLQSV